LGRTFIAWFTGETNSTQESGPLLMNTKPLIEAVPPGVTTVMIPDAPDPRIAVIVVEFNTVNEEAAMVPKVTAVAPVKFVPIIMIAVPVEPDGGENEVIVGTVDAQPVGNVFSNTIPVKTGLVLLTLIL
jgi:hypothetical protein